MRDILAALPGFGSLNAAELAILQQEASIVSASPGDTLFTAFSRTDAYWFLVEGEWRVVRKVLGVDHLMFEAARVGSWTGGVPLIDAIAPPAATVLQPSRFLRVPVSTMDRLASTNAVLAKQLLNGLHWGTGHIGGLVPSD
jgi:hypothetical protein